MWITIVSLMLIAAPFCRAKSQPIAHYNKRRQYSKKEPVNKPYRFPRATRCPGFSVGLSPKLSDVIKDGVVASTFAANSDASLENIVGSEVVIYGGTLAIRRVVNTLAAPHLHNNIVFH